GVPFGRAGGELLGQFRGGGDRLVRGQPGHLLPQCAPDDGRLSCLDARTHTATSTPGIGFPILPSALVEYAAACDGRHCTRGWWTRNCRGRDRANLAPADPAPHRRRDGTLRRRGERG